ncbi:PIN domain-containing protein, partial [Pseudomonas sp. P5_A2_2]
MPDGMPTPAQLWDGEIRFFSIDTDVIQGAGYNFGAGTLNQLHRQLPSSMELQLTDVVANEVVSHLMIPVLKTIQELQSAADNLKRKTDLPMDQVSDLFMGFAPADSSREYFRKQVEDYAERCRGGILPTEGDGILSELFRRYFAVEAPFETKNAKKSEFPDAAALLVLETYAVDNDAIGIVVSNDGGWKAFASQSEHLYCVKTLEELTTLFTATGELAAQIQTAILEAIEDASSPLRSQLSDALVDHVGNATWDVGDIYSDTGDRVEGEISNVQFADHDLLIEKTAIWHDASDPGTWLVEVTASVRVEVSTSVTTFIWDSIDRD